MKALLAIAAFVLSICILVFMPILLPPEFLAYYGEFTLFDAAKALMLCVFVAVLIGIFLARTGDDGTFMVKLFVGALLFRVFIAAMIFTLNKQDFFGGDAYTYDTLGLSLIKAWGGSIYDANRVLQFTGR